MWKQVVTSVRGLAHHTNGLPCQDAGAACEQGQILLCALSDGAGSAKFADEGSQIIVEETLTYFTRLIAEHPSPAQFVRDCDAELGRKMVKHLRSQLAGLAQWRGTSMQEFAGTLLIAIIHDTHAVFYQVGDGIWCVSRNEILGAATWPVQGDFAGQTVFVTSESSVDALQFSSVPGRVDYVVGMSDGLERLAIDFQSRIPHRGFCDPLIRTLREAPQVDEMRESLTAWLCSDRIRDRTDDDTTIALITHVDL